jgi:predicted  nucleic acid-binding Zn-ribbon protein
MDAGAQLLALQALDSELDHLARTIETPPELAPYDVARRTVAELERALTSIAQQQRDAEAQVVETETATAELDRQVQRLQQQLRNVVVVREAEALQHELATLAQRRSDLDDVGLVALESLEALEVQCSDVEQRLPTERERLDVAQQELETARAALSQRRDEHLVRRAEVAGSLPGGLLARYDTLRQRLGGVGAAALEGSRCTGCRLDLARGEVEALRSAPSDDVVDCPNCGRLLVR